MAISYRLKIKEFLFLLDIFGDPGSLVQGFGHIYIDKTEYRAIAEELDRKGIVTISENNIFAERGVAMLLKNIYSADTVFADSNLEQWVYCSDNIITMVRYSKNCPGEYLIEPFFNIGELFAGLSERNPGKIRLDFYKGMSGSYDNKKAAELLEEKYGQLK